MLEIAGQPNSDLENILVSWEGTPRMAGQRAKGVGTDCAGFVAGVYEELIGTSMPDTPLDEAFQVRTTAEQAIKAFLRVFPATVVEGTRVEPGDVILVGRRSKGLEHAMIVGNKYLWHCGHRGVFRTGLCLQGGMVVKKVLRYTNREGW